MPSFLKSTELIYNFENENATNLNEQNKLYSSKNYEKFEYLFEKYSVDTE